MLKCQGDVTQYTGVIFKSMAESNPFACLFNESKEKKQSSENDILEEIFGFTINPNHISKGRLYLEEVKNIHEKTELDINLLHYALFERLFMCNDNSELKQFDNNGHSHETKVISYLYSSYKKLKDFKAILKIEDANDIENEIIQNVVTAFQPDVYSGQNIAGEIMQVLIENEEYASPFFNAAAAKVLTEDNGKW